MTGADGALHDEEDAALQTERTQTDLSDVCSGYPKSASSGTASAPAVRTKEEVSAPREGRKEGKVAMVDREVRSV